MSVFRAHANVHLMLTVPILRVVLPVNATKATMVTDALVKVSLSFLLLYVCNTVHVYMYACVRMCVCARACVCRCADLSDF